VRYSASRQLTWQHNYNTQPRILSAAQVRFCYFVTFLWVGFGSVAASRQLTWQRNYNTQPRILSAAQVRLCYFVTFL
jgi:sensor domain CHASE-containing protein